MVGRLYTVLFRHTNLDICIGAVINALALASIFGASLSYYSLILLFNTVWIIYTMDRIIDSRRYVSGLQDRHRFHHKHRKKLLTIAALLSLVNGYFLIYIDETILLYGSALAAMIVIYLVLIWRRLNIPKEVIIAIFYTIGVFLPSLGQLKITGAEMVVLVQHSSLAFANLILISWFEQNSDRSMGYKNLAARMGSAYSTIFYSLIGINIILGILSTRIYLEIQLVFALMWIVLVVVGRLRTYFQVHDRYGKWADACFYLPALVLLL